MLCAALLRSFRGQHSEKMKGSARGNWDPREGQQPFRPNPNGVGDRTTTLRRLLIGTAFLRSKRQLAAMITSYIKMQEKNLQWNQREVEVTFNPCLQQLTIFELIRFYALEAVALVRCTCFPAVCQSMLEIHIFFVIFFHPTVWDKPFLVI